MAAYREDISQWIGKVLALENGAHPLDYVSVCVRRTARSWPQHVRVECHDRDPDTVIGELLEHVDDVAASSAAEGSSSWAVRLFAYRPGAIPAGSRTFRADYVPGAEDHDDQAVDGDGTPTGELVAAIRELRTLVRDQGGTLERMTAGGYNLANNALAQVAQMHERNGAMMAQLAEQDAAAQIAIAEAQAASGSSSSKLLEMAPMVLPAVMQMIAAQAAGEPEPIEPETPAEDPELP